MSLEEVRFCARQRLRPHGHGLDVFLERFGLFKSVFDGAVEDRLGFCGLSYATLASTCAGSIPFCP